ncbi:MAG: branched chain amino acid aminotransferase, partial [Actinomycetes bacterium]
MDSSLEIAVSPTSNPVSPERLAEILANPGFGLHFTDHMFVTTWTPDEGWHDARVTAYAPISMDPATAVLHYAQEIFEGMKAYRHEDGSVWTFRPEANAARFSTSATRLAMPHLPEGAFVDSLRRLISVDREWIPDDDEGSLYLRPFMFASEVFLGVRPAMEYLYV